MIELIDILKALSDKTRYRLIKLLLTHDYCVGALAKRLNISEAAVSQHLKVLRKAGIVNGEKRGYYTHYFVNRKLLKDVADKIAELSNMQSQEQNCSKDSPQTHNSCKCHANVN